MRTQNGHTLQFAEIRLFLQSEFIILNPCFITQVWLKI